MSALRPPTEDGAPEVARLMSEHWPEPVDPAEIASEWTSPKIDLGRDGRIGEGDDACGGAICRRHATDPDLGWVAVLAVRRERRRRGIGHALLSRAFDAFAEHGLTRAGLGVDAESPTGANSLYEDVGMSATRRFDIYERSLG